MLQEKLDYYFKPYKINRKCGFFMRFSEDVTNTMPTDFMSILSFIIFNYLQQLMTELGDEFQILYSMKIQEHSIKLYDT